MNDSVQQSFHVSQISQPFVRSDNTFIQKDPTYPNQIQVLHSDSQGDILNSFHNSSFTQEQKDLQQPDSAGTDQEIAAKLPNDTKADTSPEKLLGVLNSSLSYSAPQARPNNHEIADQEGLLELQANGSHSQDIGMPDLSTVPHQDDFTNSNILLSNSQSNRSRFEQSAYLHSQSLDQDETQDLSSIRPEGRDHLTDSLISLSAQQGYCEQHKKDAHVVCRGCKQWVCSRCVKNHPKHQLKHLTDQRKTIQHLRDMKRKQESFIELAKRLIQQTKIISEAELQRARNQNGILTYPQEEKEEEVGLILCGNIKSVQDSIEELLTREDLIKSEIEKRIETLEKLEMNEYFLKCMFEEEVPKLNNEKESSIFQAWTLTFASIRNNEIKLNDTDSLLFFTIDPSNRLHISFPSQTYSIPPSETFLRLEEVKEVILNLTGYQDLFKNPFEYAAIKLMLCYVIFRLTKVSYFSIEFENKPTCYQIVMNIIPDCLKYEKLLPRSLETLHSLKRYYEFRLMENGEDKSSLTIVAKDIVIDQESLSAKDLSFSRLLTATKEFTKVGVQVSMKSLEHCELSLPEKLITDQNDVIMLAMSLKGLKHFAFDLSPIKVDDWCIKEFANGVLPFMESLEHFEMNLQNTEVTDQSIALLLAAHIKTLKHLSLDLSKTKVGDTSLENFAADMLPSIDSLEYFELNLHKTSVTDQSASKMLKIRLPSLKHYSLNLSEAKIGDDTIQESANGMLVSMEILEEFNLCLENTQVTDKSLTLILSKQIKNLKMFTLNLSRTKVGDPSLHAFANGMMLSMGSLEKFELYLDETAVTDGSLAEILSMHLVNLKHFSLRLWGNQVGDLSVEEFAHGMLPSMKSLEHFELCLAHTQVTDASVANLLGVSLPDLRRFSLVLSGTEVGDWIIQRSTEELLPSMTSLEEFNLCIDNTDHTDVTYVKDVTYESLPQMLKRRLDSIKRFSLDLSTAKIGHQSIQELGKVMTPSLRYTSVTEKGVRMYNQVHKNKDSNRDRQEDYQVGKRTLGRDFVSNTKALNSTLLSKNIVVRKSIPLLKNTVVIKSLPLSKNTVVIK